MSIGAWRRSGVGAKSFNDLLGWDEGVGWRYFFSFAIDAGIAAVAAFSVYTVVGSAPTSTGLAICVGVGTYGLLVVVLRGANSRSVGDLLAGIQFVRATTGGRPGMIRCALNEALMLVSLPLSWFAAEFLLALFSERITGLRVRADR